MENIFQVKQALYYILLFIVLMISAYFYTKNFQQTTLDTVFRATFIGHIVILFLFFTGVLDRILPSGLLGSFIFDTLWFSSLIFGVLVIYMGFKAKKKLVVIIIPTTLVFLLFVVPILVMTFM